MNFMRYFLVTFLLAGSILRAAAGVPNATCPEVFILPSNPSPCAGVEVTFSTSVALTSYLWDFGDGTTSTLSNPLHAFTTAGQKTISVSNGSACVYFFIMTVTDCSSQCNVTISFIPTTACAGNPVSFSASNSFASYNWNFGDGTTSTLSAPSHIYSAGANYMVSLSVPATGPCPAQTYTQAVQVTEDCAPAVACENCIGTFAPDPGKYVFSVWVKEKDAFNKTTYNLPKVSIEFTGASNIPQFGTEATNKIIDGWQRIEKIIDIPVAATHMTIKLLNTGTGAQEVYFDDIRLHPVDGNMKSYVYDPETLRLMADLDENNYATFYEYDEEGALVRVKRETERGIMTVKESRSNTKKD